MAIPHNHGGHRERMKQRFLKDGIDSFSPHEVLEILLYYTVPRKDTNEIAHILIKEFGTFADALDAPIEELQKIKGLSENASLFLKLIPEVCRYYYSNKFNRKIKKITLPEAGSIFMNKFIGRVDEVVMLMLLNNAGRLLFCDVVSEGTVNFSPIYMRQIVSLSLKYNATVALIAHNHPSGIALPSKNDFDTTVSLCEALKLIDVRLIDHLVVANGDYLSIASSGPNSRYFK